MRLHHVGIVVNDIADKARLYCDVVPIGFPTEIIYDEIQQVRVAFADAGNGVAVEFIEPADEHSPVTRTLQRGTSLHHICYEVQDIEQAVAQARAAGSLIVCEPVPARAFQGRRVAFVYPQVGDLIEFVEEAKPGPGGGV